MVRKKNILPLGVVILGDTFNIRHPLTGGGMSVVLQDIIIWNQLLADAGDLIIAFIIYPSL